MENDLLLEKVALLKPVKVLDLGCGCGSFTVKLSPYCKNITAIDFHPQLIERCKKENQRPNIEYIVMDGKNLKFTDNSFDLVLERASLHHLWEWEKVIAEMLRVSSKYILIEEPIDDPRSQEKRNTILAQKLFIEIQNEVGYPHNEHLAKEILFDYFEQRKVSFEYELRKSDKLVEVDEYFESYEFFAEKSKRKDYWIERLEDFKRKLKGKKLCENDVILISIEK